MDKQVSDINPTRKSNSKSKETRDLEVLVGQEIYSSWIKMLKDLVPHGRTHRLAVLVAGMLQYAFEQGNLKQNSNNSVYLLLEEASNDNEFSDELLCVVQSFFKDAGVEYERTNSKGAEYSIAESSLQEFLAWELMPWE